MAFGRHMGRTARPGFLAVANPHSSIGNPLSPLLRVTIPSHACAVAAGRLPRRHSQANRPSSRAGPHLGAGTVRRRTRHRARRQPRRLGDDGPHPACRGGPLRALARPGRPALALGARGPRHLAALHAPGRRADACARRRQRRHHHADGLGQDALLQRAGPEHHPGGPGLARHLPVPYQGPRAGPAGRASRVDDAGEPGCRDRHRRLHLRRRHAAGRAARHPDARPHRAQQPRHAPLGDPAAPPEVGEAVREPAVRRRRRTPCVSRCLRQPPGQRPATRAAGVPPLRIRPGLHLLVGDDCQPPRAGGAAGREDVHAHRRQRRAARREAVPLRQPARRQQGARNSAVVPH